ncbi:MAG: dephospho-CoA kinase [Calditrichia bacterium]|nr:dephospho-CoA kinase [Calditrichota bacterium]MCB0268478.1 dephospho-CoA kinase [Calditrichota bacterium]MCB9066276.1 dephospho-CoA kinase [Calditrichia bacterium]
MADSLNDALIVAVTGGMGCGQSTVAGFFKKFGAKVISADDVARDLVDHDREIRKLIQEDLGKQYFFRNGRVNRRLLGEAVFADERKLHILNRIVHPRLVEKLIDEIESARDTGKFRVIVIDAALVYEIRMENMFDSIVVVSANYRNRAERIKARDKLSDAEIKNRINRQIPVPEKSRWADFTIQNNQSLEELEKRSYSVFRKLLNNAKKLKNI